MRRVLMAVSFLFLTALTPIAAQTDTCPDAPESAGGTVVPSPCVATGSQFSIRLDRYAPGQLLSVKLVGPSGVVGNMGRAIRVDANGELPIDATDYFGTALGAGAYEAWVKDPSGLQPVAHVGFLVGGTPVSPTSLAPTTAPSTDDPPAESDIAPPAQTTAAGQAPIDDVPAVSAPPRRLPDTGVAAPHLSVVLIALGILGGGIVLRRRLGEGRR